VTSLESERLAQLLRDLARVGAQMDTLRAAAVRAGVSMEFLGHFHSEPPIIEEDFL
jgi:hypothetical protein